MTQSSIVWLLNTSSMVPLGSFFDIGLSTKLASSEDRISSRLAAFFFVCFFQCFLVSSWRWWYFWNWLSSTASDRLYPSLKSDGRQPKSNSSIQPPKSKITESVFFTIGQFFRQSLPAPFFFSGKLSLAPNLKARDSFDLRVIMQWYSGQSWYRYTIYVLKVRYQP